MNPTKLLAVALLAGIAGLPQIVRAQNGWYAGLDVGKSEADASITEFVVGNPAAQDEGSDTGFRLRFGYQFSRYLSAEAGYVDFGDFEFDFDPQFCPIGVPEPCPFSTRTSISGFVTNVIGRLPLGSSWTIYARLGWFRLRVDTGEVGPGGINATGDMDGLHSAIGVGYHLTDHWELLLDYSKFEEFDLGLTVGGALGAFSFGDTRLTSLGVNYRW